MHASHALDLDSFRRQLSTRELGRDVRYHESITSTMDEARDQASRGAPHGAMVIAEEQTAGRGRRGRQFYSPARENLYFTLVLRLPLAVHRRLPIVLPLAVARAIRAEGADARVKWPNDIWINDRKVCGMLIDGEVVRNLQPVIGVRVLANICNELEALLDARLPELISEYRELSCTLGRAVTVSPSGGEAFEATALSISDDGELMVRRSNGLVEAINAADLSVRPR